MDFDKRSLMQAVLAAIDAECATIASSVNVATDGATSEESKPEGKYDTRALEASYLAGAQAERLRELRASREFLANLPIKNFGPDDPIGPSAIVALKYQQQSQQKLFYFILPQGGGHIVTNAQQKITTLTPQSPLGRAINGKQVGDEIAVETRGEERIYEIFRVW
jgi:transcription elongation GreA/GreB family factor